MAAGAPYSWVVVIQFRIRSGPAAAKHPRQSNDRGQHAVYLPHPPGGDHLDVEAGLAELFGPGAGLEEHELEIVSGLPRSVEHHLEHRLGAAEATAPGDRYEDAHARG